MAHVTCHSPLKDMERGFECAYRISLISTNTLNSVRTDSFTEWNSICPQIVSATWSRCYRMCINSNSNGCNYCSRHVFPPTPLNCICAFPRLKLIVSASLQHVNLIVSAGTIQGNTVVCWWQCETCDRLWFCFLQPCLMCRLVNHCERVSYNWRYSCRFW